MNAIRAGLPQTLGEKMELLYELKANYREVDANLDELRAEILKPVKDQLDEHDAKAETILQDIADAAVILEQEIKDAIVRIQETVESEHIKAIYRKGSITWDTAALKGYAIAHPEILKLQKQGKSSVLIKIKEE